MGIRRAAAWSRSFSTISSKFKWNWWTRKSSTVSKSMSYGDLDSEGKCDVLREDRVGPCAHGSGKDVTVLKVVRHRADEALIATDLGVLESGFHCGDSPLHLRLGVAHPDECGSKFTKDIVRPFGDIKGRVLCQPEQRVAQRHRNQHARVKNDNVLVTQCDHPAVPVRTGRLRLLRESTRPGPAAVCHPASSCRPASPACRCGGACLPCGAATRPAPAA